MTQLSSSFRNLKNQTEPKLVLLSGNLGVKLGGQELVEVATRTGYVYVRLLNNSSELIQAYNGVVSPIYDLPVQVRRNKDRYEIYGRDTLRYQNWGATPYLPIHGNQHTFDKSGGGGGDVVWVHQEQVYPLAPTPSGTSEGPNVLVAPYTYNWYGTWKYAGNTGTADVVGAIPSDPTKARVMLLVLGGASGNPYFITGSDIDISITGSAEIVPYIPSYDPLVEIPLALIRITTGTATIGWDEIYDLRQFYAREQQGSSTGSSATNFLSLTDTPDTYAGKSGQFVKVNSTENGLEFGVITGTNYKYVAWELDGVLVTGTSTVGTFIANESMELDKVYLYSTSPGTTGTTTVDIHVNGTTVFTTQANRPSLAFNASGGKSTSVAPNITTISIGDLFNIFLDAVATGIQGKLSIILSYLGNTPGGGTGDMLKSVYDTDNDGIVDNSESTKALQGTAINPSINPSDAQLLRWNDGANQWEASNEYTGTVSTFINHSQIIWTVDGANLAANGLKYHKIRLPYVGAGATLEEVYAQLYTAPGVNSLRLAIRKNGVSIFATGTTSYIELSTGTTNTNRVIDFVPEYLDKDDYFQMEVVQGDSIASDLVLHMRYYWELTSL